MRSAKGGPGVSPQENILCFEMWSVRGYPPRKTFCVLRCGVFLTAYLFKPQTFNEILDVLKEQNHRIQFYFQNSGRVRKLLLGGGQGAPPSL